MIFQKGSIRRSLTFSLWDGLFASLMLGVTDTYLIAYAIALGATPTEVATLASLPLLVGAIIQVQSARVTESIGSRTKLINGIVFFHALACIPIILVPYVFHRPEHIFWRPWILLVTAVFFSIFGAFAQPAWQSLMSDYIPLKSRGKYFGWRNLLQGIMTVLASIGAGLVLEHYGKGHVLGFTLIFIFAMTARFASFACLCQMKEPFRHTSHDFFFSYRDFLRNFRHDPFVPFVFFVSLMNFAVGLSGPLLSVFLLKDLKFSYIEYMIVITAASLAMFLFQSFWGHYADRHGNILMIKIAGWGIAVIPILWLISHRIAYLMFVQTFAGFFWGGFMLLMTNFALEAVVPERRIRSLSYLNVTNSVAVLLGALTGAFLIRHLGPVRGYSYLALFLISCAGRMIAMAFCHRFVREVRR